MLVPGMIQNLRNFLEGIGYYMTRFRNKIKFLGIIQPNLFMLNSRRIPFDFECVFVKKADRILGQTCFGCSSDLFSELCDLSKLVNLHKLSCLQSGDNTMCLIWLE